MEKMNNSNSQDAFNNPLETGIRALIILDAAFPKTFDLLELTWFDHLVVHTGDINGPPSLHPGVPSRNGELLVRRHLVEKGLLLMCRAHLINKHHNENGIVYESSDEAPAFIQLMKSKYLIQLKERAQWLAENICTLEHKQLKDLINNKIGVWNVEMQDDYRTEVNP